MDGSEFLRKAASLDCAANSTQLCFDLYEGSDPESSALTDVYFIRLELKDAAGKILSRNFYWNARQE